MHLYPLQNTSFSIFFYLYPKQLSHFEAFLDQISATLSLSLYFYTMLTAKIDCSSLSSVCNPFNTSLG